VEREERDWRRSLYEALRETVKAPLSTCGRAARLLEIRALGLAFDETQGAKLFNDSLDPNEIRNLYQPTLEMIERRSLAARAHAKLIQHRENCPLCVVFPPPDSVRIQTAEVLPASVPSDSWSRGDII
jgi:hypothetical protein